MDNLTLSVSVSGNHAEFMASSDKFPDCFKASYPYVFTWSFYKKYSAGYYYSFDSCAAEEYSGEGVYKESLSIGNLLDGSARVLETDVIIGNPSPIGSFNYAFDEINKKRILFKDNSIAKRGTKIVSWLWDFGDGTTSEEQNPSHEYSFPSNYEVTLTVVSDRGDKNEYSQRVDMPNEPPAANFRVESVSDLTFSFFDESTDTDGNIVKWEWDFGDEAISGEQNPMHTYGAAGKYRVSLKVYDDGYAEGSYWTMLDTTTGILNRDPSVNISGIGLFNNRPFISFKYDDDGIIESCKWDFGNGTTREDCGTYYDNMRRVFVPNYSNGTYNVKVTVTDNLGGKASDEATVKVNGGYITISK